MHSSLIIEILAGVKAGKLSANAALEKLKHLPYEDLSFARVDHHRHLRQGIPEVTYAKGKTLSDIKAIAAAMYKKSGRSLITKATKDIHKSQSLKKAAFYPASGVIAVGRELKGKKGRVLVFSAGTSEAQ